MKVILKTPIYGYGGENKTSVRMHADVGDELSVILRNKTHFICDSLYYPGLAIAVFPSQCEELRIEREIQKRDDSDIEKYYHVYESKNKRDIDDPFCTAFESDYDE